MFSSGQFRQMGADVVAVGLALAIASRADLSPVGSAADAFWIAVFVVAVVLLARRCSPIAWLLTAVVGAAAGQPVGVAAAALLGALSLGWAASTSLTSRAIRAASVVATPVSIVASGAVASVLFGLRDFGVHGVSALLAGALLAAMVTDVAVSRPEFIHRSRPVGIVVMSGAVLLGIPFAVTAKNLAHEVSAAQTMIADTRRSATTGDLGALAQQSAALRDGLAEVSASLDSPLLRGARHLPLIGPNVSAADGTVRYAQEVAEDAEAVIALGSPDAVFHEGRVSIEEAERLLVAAEELFASSHSLRDAIDDELTNPWVVDPLRTRLRDVSAAISSVPTASDGSDPGGALRSMLGADEPRTYLVLLANPAEARELGGFTGAVAVITVDEGRVETQATLRNGILNRAEASPAQLDNPLPQRYLEYQPHRFSQNYTATSDLPTVAMAMQDIFPSVGGHEIDGVVYLDAIALDALLAITGPIEAESSADSYAAGELARFLTKGQYARDFETRGEREQLFAELAGAAVDNVASAQISSDPAAMRPLFNAIVEGRLAFAPLDPNELDLVERLGFAGSVTPLRPEADYLAVTQSNGGPNKLDAYTHRSVEYDAVVDGDELSAVVTVTLENHAPEGLDEYASGNSAGLVVGTNRLTLIVHTPHRSAGWSGPDVEPELTRSFREYDRWRHERVVHVPRGQEVTVSLSLIGEAPSGPHYELDVDAQPLVHPEQFRLAVQDSDGTVLASHEAVVRADSTFG